MSYIRESQKEIKINDRIGVFVCHCGYNIAEYVEISDVVESAEKLDNVVYASDDLHTCSASGQTKIKEAIKEHNLDAVVVAACSPKVHEHTFQKCIKEGGLNDNLLSIANIREHCSWAHGLSKKANKNDITNKAIDITKMAVARAKYLSPLEERYTEVEQRALVIGGGIAGIQTALDIANSGVKVTLVEKLATIGGKMAQFNKVFPTNDCSACILTPKMNEVAENSNIDLMVLSELTNVEGSIGDFTVTIKKQPTYVTAECTACGTCSTKCAIKVPDPFNLDMSFKKAIDRAFDSSIPAQYYIDKEHCLKLTKDKCGVCALKCPSDAVDFTMEEEIIQLKAGIIVAATGFDVYKPENELSHLNYGKSPNIITLMTAERLLSANGCSSGELWRPSDEKLPTSVAFVLCVGSRDTQVNFEACSRACCMASIKNAALFKERYPEADVAIFYIDIRAFGKGYDEAYQRAQTLGVRFIKAKPASVRVKPGVYNQVIEYEDFLTPAIESPTRTDEFELVVYATGFRPAKGASKLKNILGLSADKYGFYMEAHPKLKPVDSTVDGIFLAGACQYPKDIPDAVSQAHGAASRALNILLAGKVKAEPAWAQIPKELCSGCRSCETVCPYSAIAMTLDDDGKLFAEVNPNLCKACGLCTATCPSGIITAPGYSDEALYEQIQFAYTR
ncbi:MAG: 4Fe-4S dicluster domain-containing protein [Candidatus Hodarchaeales archaeon]|jgi:heterodisulfide reductase subunit A